MTVEIKLTEETKRLLATLKEKENSPTYEDLIITLVKRAYGQRRYNSISSFLFGEEGKRK